MPYCHVCGKKHQIINCPIFEIMSPENRRAVVIANNMCINCLTHRHTRKHCFSLNRCSVCWLKHHTFLHRNHDLAATASVNDNPSNEAGSSNSPKSSDEQSCNVKAPLAVIPALPQAYITPLVRILLQHKLGSEWMTFMIRPEKKKSLLCIKSAYRIPSLQPDMNKKGQYTATFLIEGRECILRWTFVLADRLDVSQPVPCKDQLLQQHFDNLRPLAHNNFHQEKKIDGYIGKNSWDIIQQYSTLTEPNTPTAQGTSFDWIISGLWYGCQCLA